MKRLLLITLVLWICTLGAYSQQITFGGKKYDYRLNFPEFSFKKKPESLNTVKAPLAIYLSRNGYVAITISGKSVYQTSFGPNDIKDITEKGILIPIPMTYTRITSNQDKDFRLSLWHEGLVDIHYKEASGTDCEVSICKNLFPANTLKTLDNIYKLVESDKFFRLPALPIGTKRISMKGKDERVWYLLKKGSLYGAQNAAGQTIIPCEYDTITYHYIEGGWKYEDGGYLGKYQSRYYLAKKGKYMAAYTTKGTCVLPIEREYYIITLPVHAFEGLKIYWAVSKHNQGQGVCDGKGAVVIPPNVIPERDGMLQSSHSYIFTRFSEKTPFFFEEWAEYYTKSGNRRIRYSGAYDWNGNCIVKADKYDKFINVFDDHATGSTISSDNWERIDYAYPQTTKFDYTPYEELLTIERRK